MKINKGQSTIEFIITFSFTFGIVGLMINLAKVYVLGYVVHWATFQAGRAYLVYESHSSAVSTTENRLSSMTFKILKKYKVEKLGTFSANPNFTAGDRSFFSMGPSFTFKSRFSMLPGVSGSEEVELVSEGFLGKEPVREECAEQICNRVTQGAGSCNSLHVTLFDNGC